MRFMAKIVSKPWGNELWIADGQETPYAIKHITLLANNKTSLQVHRFKSETNYILSGSGYLLKSYKPLDVQAFLDGVGMHIDTVRAYEKYFMAKISLTPGVVVNIDACYVHRMVSETNLEFIEVSTPELDDVIRLQDDSGRAHGKILSEHGE